MTSKAENAPNPVRTRILFRHVVAAFSTVFALAIFIVNDAMRENLKDLRDDLAQETTQDLGAEQQYSINSHLDDIEDLVMRRIDNAQAQLDQNWTVPRQQALDTVDNERRLSAFVRRTRESRERLSASRSLLEKIQEEPSRRLLLDFDQLQHDSLISERAIADIVDLSWRYWNADKLPDSEPNRWEYREEGAAPPQFPDLTKNDIRTLSNDFMNPYAPRTGTKGFGAFVLIDEHQYDLNRDIGLLINSIRKLAEEKVVRLEKQLTFWTKIGYGLYSLLFVFNIWAVFFADAKPEGETE